MGRPGEMDVTERLRLLVVGEDATHVARLQALLRDALGDDADIALCHDVSDLHRALQEQSVACVVLALSSQDTANTLDPVLSSVDGEPVVVVADDEDPQAALRAIQEGAQDYVLDPAADTDALSRAIRHAIARKQTETRLARQALHDPLTGLPNRELMLDRLNVAVARSRRRPTSLALLFLDLDGFKRVNDSFGHDAGDDLLVEVARRLQRSLRPGDTVSPGRRTRCSRRATSTSSSSPTSWPRVSLTLLKPSRSRNKSASEVGRRRERATATLRRSSISSRLGRPVSGSWSAWRARRVSVCLRAIAWRIARDSASVSSAGSRT